MLISIVNLILARVSTPTTCMIRVTVVRTLYQMACIIRTGSHMTLTLQAPPLTEYFLFCLSFLLHKRAKTVHLLLVRALPDHQDVPHNEAELMMTPCLLRHQVLLKVGQPLWLLSLLGHGRDYALMQYSHRLFNVSLFCELLDICWRFLLQFLQT